MRCRAPIPPPFSVGTILLYVGPARGSGIRASDGAFLYCPGREGIVTEARAGRRGTGRVIDHDDSGDDIIDETSDGWCVIRFSVSFGTNARGEPTMTRAIPASDAHLWAPVESSR